MSLYPVLWAIDHAPVYDTEERAVLVALVIKGDFDGMNCFRSYPTLAAAARVDAKTAGRKCRAMESRGILRRQTKHQSRVWLSIPKEQRPVIWEVMIPAEWWSAAQLESINEQRASLGRTPITPESRPPLAPASPKRTRADKGVKRPKAAASPIPGTESPRVEPDITGGGVGTTSPHPGDYKSPPPGLQVPQPSETPSESPSEGTKAPAARAAGDARRATTGGSSVREAAGGSAASSGADAPDQGARSGKGGRAGVRMTAGQAAVVATVEAAWPEPLAALLPQHRPSVLRDAILAALADGRTPEQLAERVRRRWWSHGYAGAHSEGTLGSAVGVAVGLVRPPADCPDPACEDGFRIHLGPGDVCPTCEERRAARRAARRQGILPGPREAAAAPVWWDCQGITPDGQRCQATGKGPRPEDGLCGLCHVRAEAELIERATADVRAEMDAEYTAQAERARAAAQWSQMLTDAYAEHAEREAVKDAARRARRAAEAEEVRRLREQFLQEHPELAAYAQQSEEQPADAPF